MAHGNRLAGEQISIRGHGYFLERVLQLGVKDTWQEL
jgi:hypothetical protein